jgi:hypothetical protein
MLQVFITVPVGFKSKYDEYLFIMCVYTPLSSINTLKSFLVDFR